MLYIVWGIIIFLGYKFIKWFNKELDKPLDTNNICSICNYYGGFDDISAKEHNFVDLYVKEECLYFLFNKKGNIKNKSIDYKDITKVKFMNERSISQELSLGKMICFGWLSLAMKNEKVNMKEYLVIEFKNDNDINSIILNQAYRSSNEGLMTTINKELEKHR